MAVIITEPSGPQKSITPLNISSNFLADLIDSNIIFSQDTQSLTIEVRNDELLWINFHDSSGEHSRSQYKLNLRIGDEYIILFCTVPCDFTNGLDPNDEGLCPLLMGDDIAVMVDSFLLSWVNTFNYGRYTSKASLVLDEDGEQVFIAKELLFEEGLLSRSFINELVRFLDDCRIFLDVLDESHG